ncbi:MAG: glycosyltransferase [Deltaproteobacteria bacterium]|nr:glycosyltransferase [Deltaproteobacteria bacterium]
MSERILFVVLGNGYYRSPIKTSKQMVARSLTRAGDVLYVEPAPLTLDPVVKPAERSRYFEYRRGVQDLGTGEPKLLVPPPFRQAMDTRWEWLDLWNQRRLGRYVREAIRVFNYDRLVLISFVYNAAIIADELRPDVFAYYCVDIHSELRIPYAKAETVERVEAQTVARADLVFAISKPLAERLGVKHPRVIHAPHGVESALFARTAEAGPIHADLATIPTPRLGFVGVLAHWLDYELMTAIAKARPEWQLCLIGPLGPHVDVAPLREHNNIHLLGQRERAELPAFLRGFDVCLVPFLVNELTVNSSPLKAYEYVAAGRPVVSSRLPELADHAPPIRIADGLDGWITEIDRALRDWSNADAARSVALGATLSWDGRVDRVAARIREFLTTRSITE